MMLKVQLDREIHIFRFESSEIKLEDVERLVRTSFKSYPQQFHFAYIDTDGDEITIQSQLDLQGVFELERLSKVSKSAKIIKIFIREDPKEKTEQVLLVEEQKQWDSFQVLKSCEGSDYEELSCLDQTCAVQILNAIVESETEQKIIAEVVGDNMSKINEKCIQKAVQEIESSIIKKEVDRYLVTMSEEIVKKQEVQFQNLEIKSKMCQMKRRNKIEKERDEIVMLIQKSLQKLLPGFIKNLASQTIESVKIILETSAC